MICALFCGCAKEEKTAKDLFDRYHDGAELIEAAKNGDFFVVENLMAVHGESLLEDFFSNVEQGKGASLAIVYCLFPDPDIVDGDNLVDGYPIPEDHESDELAEWKEEYEFTLLFPPEQSEGNKYIMNTVSDIYGEYLIAVIDIEYDGNGGLHIKNYSADDSLELNAKTLDRTVVEIQNEYASAYKSYVCRNADGTLYMPFVEYFAKKG